MLTRAIGLPIDTDEHKAAVASDSHLRLMLQLVSFERTFDDLGQYSSRHRLFTTSLAQG